MGFITSRVSNIEVKANNGKRESICLFHFMDLDEMKVNYNEFTRSLIVNVPQPAGAQWRATETRLLGQAVRIYNNKSG